MRIGIYLENSNSEVDFRNLASELLSLTDSIGLISDVIEMLGDGITDDPVLNYVIT
jgi:hypothetical protein